MPDYQYTFSYLSALFTALFSYLRLSSCWLALIFSLAGTSPGFAHEIVPNHQKMTWQAAQLRSSWQFDIKANSNGKTYRIWLYLPSRPTPVNGYPVLWALDGNASFPALHSAHLQQLAKSKSDYQDGVIVAIGDTEQPGFAERSRSYDYTPFAQCRNCPASDLSYGGAAQFRQFISSQLRPLIAEKVALDSSRQTLFGFSYGGLFSSYVLLTEAELFQRYWITSPSLWFDQHQLLALAPQRLQGQPQPTTRLRIVLTTGYEEEFPPAGTEPGRAEKLKQRKMLSNTQAFASLIKAGYPADLELTFPLARDHGDMFDYACRRVSVFAFSP